MPVCHPGRTLPLTPFPVFAPGTASQRPKPIGCWASGAQSARRVRHHERQSDPFPVYRHPPRRPRRPRRRRARPGVGCRVAARPLPRTRPTVRTWPDPGSPSSVRRWEDDRRPEHLRHRRDRGGLGPTGAAGSSGRHLRAWSSPVWAMGRGKRPAPTRRTSPSSICGRAREGAPVGERRPLFSHLGRRRTDLHRRDSQRLTDVGRDTHRGAITVNAQATRIGLKLLATTTREGIDRPSGTRRRGSRIEEEDRHGRTTVRFPDQGARRAESRRGLLRWGAAVGPACSASARPPPR